MNGIYPLTTNQQLVQCHPSCIFKRDNFRGLLGWRGRAWMQVNPDIKVIHHSIDASCSPHSAHWACAFMPCPRECVRDQSSESMWMYQCITGHFPSRISALTCLRPNNEKSPAYCEPALLLRLNQAQLINKRLWIFSTHLSCCTEPSIRAQQHASEDMKMSGGEGHEGRQVGSSKCPGMPKSETHFTSTVRSADCSLYMFMTAREWSCGGCLRSKKRRKKREWRQNISMWTREMKIVTAAAGVCKHIITEGVDIKIKQTLSSDHRFKHSETWTIH